LLIIGDIHGCLETLKALLAKFPNEKEIYTVGDLIDRGSFSKEVIQYCIDNNIKPVLGNHEHMFLDFLINNNQGYGGDRHENIFICNGGMETLRSYGVADLNDEINIPKEHIEFLKSLPFILEVGNYIISHAGIPKGQIVLDCLNRDMHGSNTLLWNRNDIEHIEGKFQVFGHTPSTHAKVIHRDDNPIGISIDTGCVYNKEHYGNLTALYIKDPNQIEYEIHQQENIDKLILRNF
jgi:serine/threonine protein phosphatase 1